LEAEILDMHLWHAQTSRETRPPTRVAVIGAFDRFNYGDLLFPDVLERRLREVGDFPADFYASVRSDLRRLGGQRTRPLKELFQPGALPDGSAAILAGGEILDASWAVTMQTVVPAPMAWLMGRVGHRLGEGADNLYRRLSGTRLERPWIITAEDFSSRVRVAYNCVGGSNFATLPADLRCRIEARMARAAYVSVRDTETKALLEEGPLAGRVHLAPDSAILISTFYPISDLAERVTPSIRAIAERFPEGYLCFQINKNLGTGQARRIADQLENIYRRHGLAAVLLPHGRARYHEDQVVLEEVRPLLRTPAILADGELTTHDIMYLIGSARAYAGTSLHGSITALSYAVPHLGLTRAVPKLDAFLRTWDLPEHQCVPLEDLADRLPDVLSCPRALLELKRDELVAASRHNFHKMFDALGIAKPVPVLEAR
jgi:hypothetical protein